AVAHRRLRGALHGVVRGPGLLREGVPQARVLRDERGARPLSPASRKLSRRGEAHGALLAPSADRRARGSLSLVRPLLRARARDRSHALARAHLAARDDLAEAARPVTRLTER